MKRLVQRIIWVCFATSFGFDVARAQELILFKVDSVEAPYVLLRHYPIADKTEKTEIVTAKAFILKPVGSQVELTLSNVTVLRTQITREASSNIASNVIQEKMTASSLTLSFDKTEKIIFDGKALEIGQYGIKNKDLVPRVEYTGKAAEEYLKTNGNGPGLPPGYDGH